MPITTAQAAVTGKNTTSITLNGVTAGNTLVLIVGWYRDTGTQAVHPTPIDSSGNTVNVAVSPVPAHDSGTLHDAGASIFYVTNASAGMHTMTLTAMTANNVTLVEFTPLIASSFDVATSALTQGSSGNTTQATGTTASTSTDNELVVIGCTLSNTAAGTNNVGWTLPVAGFTTLQHVDDLSVDLPVNHAWKEVNAIGTQQATFNWSVSNATGYMQASIATFIETVSSGTDSLSTPASDVVRPVTVTLNIAESG